MKKKKKERKGTNKQNMKRKYLFDGLYILVRI